MNYENARNAEWEARQERDHSRLLLDVNNAVVSHLDLSELLKSISVSLGRMMSVDSAFIALCNPEGTRLQVQALDLGRLKDVAFEKGLFIPAEGTPEEQAILTGQPVLAESVAGLLKFSSPYVHHAVEHGVKSGCFLPLIAHGRTLGALGVVSLREEAFSAEDAELLQQCSSQIAIAVQNALNFGDARQAELQVRQERDRSQLLLDINNALVSHLDLGELVKAISRSLQNVLQHDCVGLAIHDAESGKMFSQAVSSDLQPMHEGIYFSPEGTATGLTFKTRRPVYIPRHDTETSPSPVTKGFFDRGLKSLYAVPVTVHGRIIGVMSISSVREDAFSSDDQEIFRQVANQVAIAAANAIAVRELEALQR